MCAPKFHALVGKDWLSPTVLGTLGTYAKEGYFGDGDQDDTGGGLLW